MVRDRLLGLSGGLVTMLFNLAGQACNLGQERCIVGAFCHGVGMCECVTDWGWCADD